MARKITNRKGRKACAIVVDGETEAWYLQKLKEFENLNIAIEPELPQNKSIDTQYKTVIEKFEKGYDKIFWLIDFDTILKEEREKKIETESILQKFKLYFESFQKGEYKEKVEVLINTPCLEFWFLLHFKDTGKFYSDCKEVIRDLKKHKELKEYEKTEKYYKQSNNIYKRLKPFLNTAKENASKLIEFDFDNPLTAQANIFKIVEYLSTKK